MLTHYFVDGNDAYEMPTFLVYTSLFNDSEIGTAVGRVDTMTGLQLYTRCDAVDNASFICFPPFELTEPQAFNLSLKVGEFTQDAAWSEPVTIILFGIL